MKKHCLYLPLIAFLFFAAARIASADEIKTDYNHHANFREIHTYSWGDVKTTDPFYVDRIKEAVDRDLQAKGWQLVPSGGEAMIFAHDNIQNQQELETFYNGGGWGGRWGWGGWDCPGFTTTTVTNQHVGHLVIDVFNGNSKDLLWRGISTRDLSKKEDKNAKAFDKDIDKMFKKFPAKSKG